MAPMLTLRDCLLIPSASDGAPLEEAVRLENGRDAMISPFGARKRVLGWFCLSIWRCIRIGENPLLRSAIDG